jgi:hypothetical protein
MTRNVDDSRLRNRVSVCKKQIIIIKEQNFVLLLNVVENIRSNDDETQNKKITTEGCKLALLIFHPTVNQFLFPSIEQCHCQMCSLLLLPLLCIAKMHSFFFNDWKLSDNSPFGNVLEVVDSQTFHLHERAMQRIDAHGVFNTLTTGERKNIVEEMKDEEDLSVYLS